MKVRSIIGIFASTLLWTTANAAIISSNDITGDDPGLENPYTAGLYVAPNTTALGIGRGSGITGRSGDNRYSASSWSEGGLDTSDYFTFILDANDGYQMSLTSFSYTGQRSSTGPSAFAFRSSLDSFATDIGTPAATGATIDLSASSFQSLTGPVEFRLYGYSAGGSTGTFGVENYAFNGEVAAIPEPQTLSLLGVGALLLLLKRRRMRFRKTG
ncbi:MAG: PEP-CTERM sorting domain-containing protein [Chlorobiaceae bacterium]|nr:PEP-CTERM sorting domain-containing protein [Chlorobiaceae bacterium]